MTAITATKPKPPTPELDRMMGVHEESQTIGCFLDWLTTEKGYTICEDAEDDDGPNGYWPIRESIEKLLASYYGIDLDKIERERRALLDYVRATSSR